MPHFARWLCSVLQMWRWSLAICLIAILRNPFTNVVHWLKCDISLCPACYQAINSFCTRVTMRWIQFFHSHFISHCTLKPERHYFQTYHGDICRMASRQQFIFTLYTNIQHSDFSPYLQYSLATLVLFLVYIYICLWMGACNQTYCKIFKENVRWMFLLIYLCIFDSLDPSDSFWSNPNIWTHHWSSIVISHFYIYGFFLDTSTWLVFWFSK